MPRRKNAAPVTPPSVIEVVFPIALRMVGHVPVWRIESAVGVGPVAVSKNEKTDDIEHSVSMSQQGFVAVWDTGAPQTMVDVSVAKAVKLVPNGTTTVSGVTGEPRKCLKAPLAIAMQAWKSKRQQPHHYFHIVEEAVVVESLGVQVLVGMDIIMRGDTEISADRASRRVLIWRTPIRRKAVHYPPQPGIPGLSQQ